MSIVILMTACICPPNKTIKTVLQDKEIRKKQYLEAINYYLRETNLNIVFCDNSDVVIWDEISNPDKMHRLEYLTFNGEGYQDRGKGYGEALIIQYALSNSRFLRDATYVVKITGRVKVININSIQELLPTEGKNVIIGLCSDIGLILSSVCFAATTQWLKQWVTNYREDIQYGEGATFEDVLFKAFVEDSKVRILRFNPILDGICAGTNAPYGNNDEVAHKHIHYSKLCRLYKLRGDKYNTIKTWFIWRWYSILSSIKKINSIGS